MSTPPRGNDAPFSSATTVSGVGADALATGGADAVLAREHAARVCAEALVFSRDRVLSLVSHDLRGPLNAIHSWAHVLERKLAVDDPGIARAIAGIRTGVEQQVKLIEEVIDQTRKETRHLTLSLTAVPLLPCVAGELDSIERTLPVESASGIRRGFALEGVTATLDAPRFAQAWWTVVMYALAQRVIGTVVEASGTVDGDRIEVAVVFTPRPEDDAGAVATGTPSSVSADRDGGTKSLAAYTAFLNAPRQLDNGKLPLALAQRVAVAHGGELIDETLADSRRRLALRQPAVARPPQY
ncbi:sensor histidine kinase [Robbsia andropogonis]|uniref:sensor histidine kinase n=1 Tax=Robbsia andropogonis TaxID=28092 RepID=UPI0004660E64|nr:histidine kinase dimerization/phospho-acceptor domain-containing protein [Robbsia andropogonis]